MTSPEKVLVALSGGVDSTVSALLLQKQGYWVEAAVICFSPSHMGTVCAAQRAADFLQIPLHIIHCEKDFDKQIITPFISEYLNGRTPNPCVVCNPQMKFNRLIALSDQLGIQKIATGHYARICNINGRFAVQEAVATAKDQSYMLYRLTQEQLSRVVFPLGEMSKEEVRALAEKDSLPCAGSPDSQDICFLDGNDYQSFIEKRTGGCPPGNFISPDGQACGRHLGIHRYTVGQRKHLGIALGERVFIKHIDMENNCIYLAREDEAFVGRAELTECVYIDKMGQPFEAEVKIRYRSPTIRAKVVPQPDNCAEIQFHNPQRAVTPGQSCVFYQEGIVLGGGFFNRIKE